jgi:hypothetical protein
VKTAWATLIAAVLLFSIGCTRPDWIEATLVTVDVTGVWQGTVQGGTGPGVAIRDVTLKLQQEGPKVRGTMAWTRGSGPLEGTVGGDVFHFTVVSGGESSGGQLIVSGDEMVGDVTFRAFEGSRTVRVFLRRADAPASPRR